MRRSLKARDLLSLERRGRTGRRVAPRRRLVLYLDEQTRDVCAALAEELSLKVSPQLGSGLDESDWYLTIDVLVNGGRLALILSGALVATLAGNGGAGRREDAAMECVHRLFGIADRPALSAHLLSVESASIGEGEAFVPRPEDYMLELAVTAAGRPFRARILLEPALVKRLEDAARALHCGSSSKLSSLRVITAPLRLSWPVDELSFLGEVGPGFRLPLSAAHAAVGELP
jgi:hypothetical protein